MNYETLYNEMKYSLFTAVKASADVLLELIRKSKSNTTEFETAKHCYNALYEQIDRCNLVTDYEEWEWQTDGKLVVNLNKLFIIDTYVQHCKWVRLWFTS